MSAILRAFGPDTSAREPPNRLRRGPALPALALLMAWCQGAAQEPVPAVWKEREVGFTYQSSIAIYSCNALRARIGSILRAVGARPDLRITLANCDTSVVLNEIPSSEHARVPPVYRPGAVVEPRSQRPQAVDVRVLLSTPVAMTPDVIAELKADKSRRELITRATGNPLPRFDDPIPFAAERQVLTLSRDTIGLEPAECELLDQLSACCFRELDVRIVRRDYSCDRRRVSKIPPELDVEALVPAALGTVGTQSTATGAGGDDDGGAPKDGGEAAEAPAADPRQE